MWRREVDVPVLWRPEEARFAVLHLEVVIVSDIGKGRTRVGRRGYGSCACRTMQVLAGLAGLRRRICNGSTVSKMKK